MPKWVLWKIVDPDEMLHNAAFHWELGCLPSQNQSLDKEIGGGRI